MGIPVPEDDLPVSLSGQAVPADDLPDESPGWGRVLGDIPGMVADTTRATIAGMQQRALEELQTAHQRDGTQPDASVAPALADAQARFAAAKPGMSTTPGANIWQRGLQTGAVSAAQVIPSLAVGVGTRNPQLAAAMMFPTTEGLTYGNLRSEGLDQTRAGQHAAVQGAIETGTELLPFDFLLKNGDGFIKKTVGFLMRELPGESLATLGQGASDYVAAAQAKGQPVTPALVWEGVKQASSQLPDTWVATVIGGGLQTAPFALAQRAAGGTKPTSNDPDKQAFRRTVGEPGEPVPADDLPINLEAVQREYQGAPQLPGPPGAIRPPAPDFTVDPYGRAARPGQPLPSDRGLPAPSASGQYDVSQDGSARPLTQAEAELRNRQRQARLDMGLGEVERRDFQNERAPAAGWNPESAAGQQAAAAPAVTPTEAVVPGPRPMEFDAIDQEIEGLTGKWGANAPRLEVVDEEGQLDPTLLRSLGSGVRGFYDGANRRIGLIRQNVVADARRRRVPIQTVVREVIAHEGVGHYGMINMLGPRWGWVKGQVQSLAGKDARIGEIAAGVARDYADQSADVQAAETVARFAEEQPDHPFVQRVIAWVKEAIRTKLGIDLELTTNDLVAMLRRAEKFNERGGARGQGAMASRSGTPTYRVGNEQYQSQVRETTGRDGRVGFEVLTPEDQSLGVFDDVPTAARAAQREVQGQGLMASRGPAKRTKAIDDLKGRTLPETLGRIPEETRTVSPNVRRTIDGREFSSLDPHKANAGFLPRLKLGVERTNRMLRAALDEAIAESNLPPEKAALIKLRDAEDWHHAMQGTNLARFWYEFSAEGFIDKFFALPKQLTERLIDVVAASSGNKRPTDNVRDAISTMAQDQQLEPVTVGVRDPASLGSALSPTPLDTHKFGNFSNTMQLVAGLRNEKPLPTIDLQMANFFGVPQAEVAGDPRMYETLARMLIKVRDMQNRYVKATEQPWESWQVQAATWVWQRGTADPEDYSSAMPEIIRRLKAAGIPLEGGKIGLSTLRDPRVAEVLSPTSKSIGEAMTATVETRTKLTSEGARAAQVLEAIRSRPEPWARNARREYERIQRKSMEELANKRGVPGSKTKQPSVLGDFISAIVGRRVEVSRIDTQGHGTFEDEASPNMRIPLNVAATIKGVRQRLDLTVEQVRYLLAALGSSLKQAAMAASQFKSVDLGQEDTYTVFVHQYEGTDISPEQLAALGKQIGYPLNYSKAPNGWVIDINTGGFDTKPDPQAVWDAVHSVLPGNRVILVPRSYASEYLEAPDYGQVIEGYESARQAGVRDAAASAGAGDRGRARDLAALRESITEIGRQQDARLQAWSDKYAQKAGVTPAPDVLASRPTQTGPVWYSHAQRTVEAGPARAPGQAWLGYLRNKGVKADELTWTGADEWLAKQGGPVAKGELLDYLKAHEVKVEEVVKGGPPRVEGEITDDDGNTVPYLIDSANGPKFSNWQLPGGANYRELLLTIPGNEFTGGHYDEPNVLAHVRFNDRTDADGKRVLFIEEIQSDWHQRGRKEGYRSSKMPESDWRQWPTQELKQLLVWNDRNGEYQNLSREQVLSILESWGEGEVEAAIQDRGNAGMDSAVPDAPFKTTWPELSLKRMIRWAAENGYDRIAWTPGEVQADRYDLSKQIKSITAFREGDRYTVVAYDKGDNVVMNGKYQAEELPNVVGKELTEKIVAQKGESERTYSGLDLKVGGEGMRGFYDKILVDAANKLGKKFGAKVGRTGISAMDRKVEVEKYGDQWRVMEVYPDGQRVIFATLPSEARAKSAAAGLVKAIGERDTVAHSLDITPQMRESVMQGQPLASRPEGMSRDTSATTGANAPQAQATPDHVEAGGGRYTTAPMQGLDPQAQDLLLRVMAAEDANIATERGGEAPITWEQTGGEAKALLEGSFGKTFNSLVNRIPRSAANAKMLEAYAQLVNSSGKALKAAAEQYARTGSADDLLRLEAAREQAGMVLAPFMGYRTEAGRALNILRKVQADFADANAIFEALGDGREQAMREFAKRIRSAGSVADALAITQASYKATPLDQYREFWMNSILSGPWTHAVNVLSNAAYMALEAATELGVSAFSSNIPARVALAKFTGTMAGVRLGLVNAGKAFATEEPQLNQKTQAELEKYRAIPGKTGRVIRTPGRALMAEDEFFKALNYTAELHRLAMEEALKANPKNPHAAFERILRSYANNRAVQAQARAHADRMTFQKDLGAIGKGFMQLRGKLGPIGWLLAPFVRTPTNILKAAAEYSPTAFAMPSVRAAIAEGGRNRDLAYGRMLVGTATLAGVASAVLQGMMTGAGPDDPEEKALWMRTGKKPYSIKVGDEWVKYNRFEPVGMLLGVAADMTEIGQTMQKGQYDKLGTMLLSSIMLNLADKTYLRGIMDFNQMLQDPKRYASQWASSMVGSHIPNIVAQGARATDPFVRDARGLVDSLKARVPGLRQSLPAKLDVAGEPIEASVVEPLAASRERDDPLARTMLELGVFMGAPSRKVILRGRELDLTGEQYASLKEATQRARWGRLTPMVTSRGFRSLMEKDPARASAALRNQYTQIGEAVKLKWLKDHGLLAQLRATPPKAPTASNYAEAR